MDFLLYNTDFNVIHSVSFWKMNAPLSSCEFSNQIAKWCLIKINLHKNWLYYLKEIVLCLIYQMKSIPLFRVWLSFVSYDKDRNLIILKWTCRSFLSFLWATWSTFTEYISSKTAIIGCLFTLCWVDEYAKYFLCAFCLLLLPCVHTSYNWQL